MQKARKNLINKEMGKELQERSEFSQSERGINSKEPAKPDDQEIDPKTKRR